MSEPITYVSTNRDLADGSRPGERLAQLVAERIPANKTCRVSRLDPSGCRREDSHEHLLVAIASTAVGPLAWDGCLRVDPVGAMCVSRLSL